MRIGFGVKIGIAISVLAVGITSASLSLFYAETRSMLLFQMGNRLKDIGRTAEHLFTVEHVQAIAALHDKIDAAAVPLDLVIADIKPGEYRQSIPTEKAEDLMKGKDFQRLVHTLREIKNSTREQNVEGKEHEPTIAYATLLTTIPREGSVEVLRFLADADYNDPDFPNPVGNLFFNNSSAILEAFSGVVAADTDFRHENSQYLLSAGVPLRDDKDKVIAVLALDYNAQSEVNKVQDLRRICIAIVAGSFLLSLCVATLIARWLNRPIRELREGAERVASRDFSTHIPVQTADEIGLLAKAFNSMVEEIKTYAGDLEHKNLAFSRFVPQEFLRQLGKEDIVAVALGDQVQKKMTVLFSDIRSFTTISESMSPRENFTFINDYLSVMSPIIREHGGFVDKYIGDGIMALFADGVDAALQAALQMQHALIKFNEIGLESGRPLVRIGIGLHTGTLMLGTVGESLRMDGTVISDAVNLSSRLESLTKEYGADIIISEHVLQAMGPRNKCHTRFLGPVQVKGKRHKVHVYEVIDESKGDVARRKIISIPEFERAVKSFLSKRPVNAGRLFRRVLKMNPEDGAAKMFLEQCKAQMLVRDELRGKKDREQLVNVTVKKERA